ncbi:hypothetical protein ACFV90_01120 [Streptomyces sp. NPDC059904]|uniref:hypothetical protein n=1 Tax=unclassified Streptomyces TaxID=2593676 RepID=UPI0036599F43
MAARDRPGVYRGQGQGQRHAGCRRHEDPAVGGGRRGLAKDGRLTDAETRRVFALRQEDAVTPQQVLANLSHTDRSADGSRITLTARVNGLRSMPWYEGCCAFRVDLRARTVTARSTVKTGSVPGS